MAVIDVGGRRISYWAGRKGVLEGRTCLLFIHGAGGGQYTWSFQKAFFEREFNPIILELSGHGDSEGDGEQEIGRYAEQAYRFLKALDLPKPFLVGHSMGGAIVQTMALRYPEAIGGIVLVGTGARLRVLPEILQGIREDYEAAVRRINELAFSPKAPAHLVEQGLTGMRRCRPEVVHGDFTACDRFDLMREVERINLPTLILCGDEDRLTPVKYSQFLHQRIKGSRLEIIPGAGHMVMMEAPSIFNEKVREFVQNPIPSESE
ncbi:MAG: alpha/beta hydrolase [Desulfobacterota bacterium]|nr:alpha/beta hydrolase [Thermodesulfobacteriota bacterium]